MLICDEFHVDQWQVAVCPRSSAARAKAHLAACRMAITRPMAIMPGKVPPALLAAMGIMLLLALLVAAPLAAIERRGIFRAQVAPALEGLLRPELDRHQLGVQPRAGGPSEEGPVPTSSEAFASKCVGGLMKACESL